MREKAISLLKRYWRQGTLAVVVIGLGAAILLLPHLRVKAAGIGRLIIGSSGEPVTIITENGEADALKERMAGLEAEVAALKEARLKDGELITSLQQEYQAASAEVAAAHDTFVREAEQARAVSKKAGTGSSSGVDSPTASSSVAELPTVSKKVSINRGTLAQLDSLPGIGPSYAQRIIDYRTEHGAFKSIDDLDQVSGIGPATIDKIRDLIEL
ncbi:MAG TPA: ComEA family DNA-binding protein [Verrucomicrobiae bacterium]|nr:ComEA family DNA-binding protein [Verrucomicrobiae bacterium]